MQQPAAGAEGAKSSMLKLVLKAARSASLQVKHDAMECIAKWLQGIKDSDPDLLLGQLLESCVQGPCSDRARTPVDHV